MGKVQLGCTCAKLATVAGKEVCLRRCEVMHQSFLYGPHPELSDLFRPSIKSNPLQEHIQDKLY